MSSATQTTDRAPQPVTEQPKDLAPLGNPDYGKPAQGSTVFSVAARRRATAKFLDQTDAAIQKLVDIMHSLDATPAEQMRAAIEILDRGLGKAVNANQINERDQGSGGLDPAKLSQLGTEDLQQLLMMLRSVASGSELQQPGTIEHETASRGPLPQVRGQLTDPDES